MKLSEHFTLDELAVTTQSAFKTSNRTEAAAFTEPLARLCGTLLEPVRGRFGPVIILSGYRSAALNRAIKGAAASQHCKGEAADFYAPAASLDTLFAWIRGNLPPESYGQLIREPGWIHVSLGKPYRQNSGEVLIFDGTTYRKA